MAVDVARAMTTRRHRTKGRAQRGMAAGVLLAVTAGFAAMAVTGVLALQQQRGAADQAWAVEQARLAAQAGLQWGRWQALRTPLPGCAAARTLVLPGALSTWRVTVRCTVTGTHTEGAVSRTTFRIEATGCSSSTCPGLAGQGYAESFTADWVVRP